MGNLPTQKIDSTVETPKAPRSSIELLSQNLPDYTLEEFEQFVHFYEKLREDLFDGYQNDPNAIKDITQDNLKLRNTYKALEEWYLEVYASLQEGVSLIEALKKAAPLKGFVISELPEELLNLLNLYRTSLEYTYKLLQKDSIPDLNLALSPELAKRFALYERIYYKSPTQPERIISCLITELTDTHIIASYGGGNKVILNMDRQYLEEAIAKGQISFELHPEA